MLKWQFWLRQKLSLKGEIDFVGYLCYGFCHDLYGLWSFKGESRKLIKLKCTK